jgi:hypothetical protein
MAGEFKTIGRLETTFFDAMIFLRRQGKQQRGDEVV